MKKFKIDWTNNSIKYSNKEKKYLFKAIDGMTPLTQGKYLDLFQKSFSKYLGVKHSYAVSNCSNALDMTAVLLDTKSNDEFIVPAHTWCATPISYLRFGGKIKWADINPDTLVISIDSIKKLVTKKTKAIIVVHLYGLPANMPEIIKFAKEKNIAVVEDCAQSLGSTINNKKTGSYGDMSVFSFHSNKLMTTLGEGGMLVINNKKYNKNVEALRHNGVTNFNRKDKSKYWLPAMSNVIKPNKDFWPYNFCLGEPQCATGLIVLKRLDKLNQSRIKRAKQFIQFLKNYKELTFQKNPTGYKNVYHCLVARFKSNNTKKRNFFINLISKKYKIKVIVQNCPLDRYELFRNTEKQKLTNSNNFFDNMVSWPFYTYMSEREFNYMMLSTKKAIEETRKKFS